MKFESAQLNPKDFVRLEPVPSTSHNGIKIQARNLKIYNATVPLRQEICKSNYNRRRDQDTMGFNTPNNVPYKIIGSPLYLEQKQIILNGLGQFSEGEENNFNTSNDIVGGSYDSNTDNLQKIRFGLDNRHSISNVSKRLSSAKIGKSTLKSKPTNDPNILKKEVERTK
jgi:hypothetical protein